jgi:uncharacterized protein (TIGR02646 family)
MGIFCKKIWSRIVIRIQKYPPPAHYFTRVHKPGNAYLLRNPQPTSSELSRHSYWRAIHDDLYRLYNGICAYCSSWTPRTPSGSVDRTSVDHFIPKSSDPILAYDWENFRLCRARINNNKGDSHIVIDPFHVQDGWFQIDFTTFLIISKENVPQYLQSRITGTIDVLGLNDSEYVEERLEVIKQYCQQAVTLAELQRLYPFIAFEIIRTDFDTRLKNDMAAFFNSTTN